MAEENKDGQTLGNNQALTGTNKDKQNAKKKVAFYSFLAVATALSFGIPEIVASGTFATALSSVISSFGTAVGVSSIVAAAALAATILSYAIPAIFIVVFLSLAVKKYRAANNEASPSASAQGNVPTAAEKKGSLFQSTYLKIRNFILPDLAAYERAEAKMAANEEDDPDEILVDLRPGSAANSSSRQPS
jgi:hypothetical protein